MISFFKAAAAAVSAVVVTTMPGQAQISGETVLEECSAAAATKALDAMALVIDRLDDPRFMTCLREAIWTEDFGATPEHVLTRLKDDMPTRIICKARPCNSDTALGCAGVGDGPEEFTIKTDFLEDPATTPANAGSVIVHEIAHRKGFGHPGDTSRLDYPFTIPVQAGRCIRELRPTGPMRSAIIGETETAFAGGPGGRPFQRICPGTTVVTGLAVLSSAEVHRIAVHCGSLTLAPVGEAGAASLTIDRRCPSGSAASGLRLKSDRLITHISMACTPIAELTGDDPMPQRSLLYLGGNAPGEDALRLCPPGMAMTGLRGRSGARIDRLRVVCDDIDGLRQGAVSGLALVGVRDGAEKDERCLGHSVITALYGHSGGSLDRLGGSCRGTRAKPGVPSVPELVFGNNTRHVFDWNGGNGGQPFALPCPDGQALVGLDLRRIEGVDAVRGACADLGAWVLPSAADITVTQWTGRGTGAVTERRCPRGQFLVGLQSWAKKTVHAEPTLTGLVPLCRRIDFSVGLAPD